MSSTSPQIDFAAVERIAKARLPEVLYALVRGGMPYGRFDGAGGYSASNCSCNWTVRVDVATGKWRLSDYTATRVIAEASSIVELVARTEEIKAATAAERIVNALGRKIEDFYARPSVLTLDLGTGHWFDPSADRRGEGVAPLIDHLTGMLGPEREAEEPIPPDEPISPVEQRKQKKTKNEKAVAEEPIPPVEPLPVLEVADVAFELVFEPARKIVKITKVIKKNAVA